MGLNFLLNDHTAVNAKYLTCDKIRMVRSNHYLGNGCEEYTFWNNTLCDNGESPWGWKQNALIHVDSKTRTATLTPEYYAVRHYSQFVTPGSRVIAYKPSTEGRTPVLVVETPEKKKGSDSRKL